MKPLRAFLTLNILSMHCDREHPKETVRTETVHTKTVHTETVNTKTVHTETVHKETVHTETVHTETVNTKTVHTETVPLDLFYNQFTFFILDIIVHILGMELQRLSKTTIVHKNGQHLLCLSENVRNICHIFWKPLQNINLIILRKTIMKFSLSSKVTICFIFLSCEMHHVTQFMYRSPLQLRYLQLRYFRSYAILNWVQKNLS